MKMQAIREKAKMLDLKSGKMKKVDLIHAIQAREGNSVCFDTGKSSCDQMECSWRDDCLTNKNDGRKMSV